MSPADAAPYEALVQLIERELELVREARYDDLAEAAELRAQFVQALPSAPPASAAEPLRRAAQLQQLLVGEALDRRDALLKGSAEIVRASRAARGYAPPRRRDRLSASA